MPHLKAEARLKAGWVPVGPVIREGDQPGSVSNKTADGRELILFICQGNRSLVIRSRNGFDIEKGADQEVFSQGFERLAALAAGESYEMPVTLPHGLSVDIRWTHVEE